MVAELDAIVLINELFRQTAYINNDSERIKLLCEFAMILLDGKTMPIDQLLFDIPSLRTEASIQFVAHLWEYALQKVNSKPKHQVCLLAGLQGQIAAMAQLSYLYLQGEWGNASALPKTVQLSHPSSSRAHNHLYDIAWTIQQIYPRIQPSVLKKVLKSPLMLLHEPVLELLNNTFGPD